MKNIKQNTFEEVFRKFEGTVANISRRYFTTRNIPIDEMTSRLNQCLWECYERFDEAGNASFRTYVNTSLRRTAINVSKSKFCRYYEKTIPYEIEVDENSDDSAATLEVAKTENDVVEKAALKDRKKADQQRLIDFLLESARIQSDSTMTAIIEGLVKGDALRSIGRSLGIHPETVGRKIRRLSRFYDENKFGDLRDYLST